MSKVESFEVYAIRYATVSRHAGENFIGGDPHEAGTTMDYYVWIARSSQHIFLIDTGFDRKRARARGRNFLRCPTEGLELLGIAPEEINSVVLTHLHYDHGGNLALFPNAKFYIQDSEVAFATGRYMRHGFLRQAYEVEDIVELVRSVYANRVHFIDGSSEIAPGLHVHHVGGHCAGLQAVQIWTGQGWLVLASDATHYYANLETNTPFPIVFDVGQMLEGYNRLRELASSPSLIVPGHDPEVMNRFEAPSKEMEGAIVRLA
ncbi:Glyoxylase, beta-lactamase superfamily II [Modicisalibacter muralis]|uniref:Glyoxylase, beta-lactamase superfamily II n=1 Tax=Modicisalibacter muralis TaxID=119000 RepID=A0A1G9LLW1_9GAMM|nr:N-acyl homoserine lactonase family protein [Halomonas muralis]SDL62823.1 Glyoxylase, beta-lactamase superfamily II [Halomonas muralis]